MQKHRSTPKLHFFTDDGEVFSYLMRGQLGGIIILCKKYLYLVVIQKVGNRAFESEELTPTKESLKDE